MSLLLTAQGGVDGNATGATLTDNASLIAGVATGGAVANGATIAPSASLVSGQASGAATATGAVTSANASLLAGAATGSASAGAETLGATAGLTAGVASGTSVQQFGGWGPSFSPPIRRHGTAPGALIVAIARVQPGRAIGDAVTQPRSVHRVASLIQGRAHASATAKGVTITIRAMNIKSGRAEGEDNFAYDNEFLIAA